MSEQFDPYHKWLGIQPDEQPANHYRLLGITLFEDDLDTIANAADQRMAHARSFQLGRHADLSQRILNELSAAKVCLLNSVRKLAYDEQLRKTTKNSLPLARPQEVTQVQSPPLPEAISNSFDFDAAPTLYKKSVKKNPTQLPLALAAVVIGVLALLAIVVISMSQNNGTAESKGEVASKPTDASKPPPVVPASKPQPKAEPKPVPQPKPMSQVDPVPQTEAGPPLTVPTPTVESRLQDNGESLSKAEERLEQALAAAKIPDDYRAVAEKGLALADRAIVEGNADLATTAVKQSLLAARKADDIALTKRATQLLMQLQNPISESLKDEAKKRRDMGQNLVRAVEELPPNPLPETSTWLVVFRSKDPSIWNTNVNKGPDEFALPLTRVPDDIRYLRMSNARSNVIIEVTRDKLQQRNDNNRYGWNGTNRFIFKGHHLGIYSKDLPSKERGMICITANGGRDCRGWGFGRRGSIDDRQGYSWAGEAIDPVVFEIAVKSGTLNQAEKSNLLK